MVPTDDVRLNRRHREGARRWAHVALVSCLLVGNPAHLEPVRWWWSSPIVSALAVTPEQSNTIEGLYEASLPARRSASERVISLTEKVAGRLRDGAYDAELLNLTSQLVNARWDDCDRRRQFLDLSARPLSQDQREKLILLIQNQRVAE